MEQPVVATHIKAAEIGVGDVVVGQPENPPSQGYTVTAATPNEINVKLEFAGVPGYQLQKLTRKVWVYKLQKGITQHGE